MLHSFLYVHQREGKSHELQLHPVAASHVVARLVPRPSSGLDELDDRLSGLHAHHQVAAWNVNAFSMEFQHVQHGSNSWTFQHHSAWNWTPVTHYYLSESETCWLQRFSAVVSETCSLRFPRYRELVAHVPRYYMRQPQSQKRNVKAPSSATEVATMTFVFPGRKETFQSENVFDCHVDFCQFMGWAYMNRYDNPMFLGPAHTTFNNSTQLPSLKLRRISFCWAIDIDSASVLQCPNKHTGEIQAKVRSLPATNFNVWVIIIAADRVSTKTMQRNWCTWASWTCTPKSSNKLSKNGDTSAPEHRSFSQTWLKLASTAGMGKPHSSWGLKLTTLSGIYLANSSI